MKSSKYILALVVLASSLLFFGCRAIPGSGNGSGNGSGTGTITTPTPPVTGKPISPGSGVVGAYYMQDGDLVVEGVGKSRDLQTAREEARSDAWSSLSKIVNKTVGLIADARELQKVSVSEFSDITIEQVGEKTMSGKTESGITIYRSTQTFKFGMESILKDIYKRLNPSAAYSYEEFVKDFEKRVGQKKQ